MKSLYILIIFLLSFVKCTTMHINLRPEPPEAHLSSFDHHSHYFLFHLLGADTINLNTVCGKGQPVQLRHYFNFEDKLFALSTLGIYTPKSLRIWCSNVPPDSQPL